MNDPFVSPPPESSPPGFRSREQPVGPVRILKVEQPFIPEMVLSEGDDPSSSLKEILDQVPVAIRTTDETLKLTFNDGALAHLLDTEPEQYLGCRMQDYLRKDNYPDCALDIYQNALAGRSDSFTAQIGSRRLQTKVTPLRNSTSQVIGTLSLTLDLTDQIQSESLIKRQMEQLAILKKVISICSTSTQPDDLISDVIQCLSDSSYRENISIYRVDESSESLIRYPSDYSQGNNQTMDRIPIGLGVKGGVARTGKINRLTNGEDGKLVNRVEPGIQSEICVPILVNRRVVGVIDIESAQRKAFHPSDEDLLGAIARLISNGIARIRGDQEEIRRNTELESLHQVNLRLSNNGEIQASLGSLLENTLQLVSADESVILLLDSTGLTFTADAWSQEYAQNPVSASRIKEVAGEVVRTGKVLTWPGGNGSVLHSISFSRVSIVGIPLYMENRIKGVFITAYLQPHTFKENDLRVLELLADQAVFALKNAELSEELENAYLQTVLSLAKTVDTRDSDTSDHSQKMSILAEATSRVMGKEDFENRSVFWAALLHDIGKIGIPDLILRKPGSLNEDEWRIMRKHPELGAEIIKPVKHFEDVAPMILSHHERWDGTGYPRGLKSTEIPLGGRIVAVVDAFTAITSDRVYRKARSMDEAIQELRANSGTQFDPDVVTAFLTLLTELEPGKPA